MKLFKHFSLIALLLGFITAGFVISANAQPGRASYYGNNGNHYGWTNGRHRGWRNRDRRWRYSRWRDDDDDDRRRYRRYRTRNSGYSILGSILGIGNYNNGYYDNNYYYGNSRRYEKERRKAWKRYRKAQRKAYRRGYNNSWYRY